MSLDDDARAELKQLEAIGRLRVPRVVGHRDGPKIALDGANVLDFASNDYLSLATDRRVVAAAKLALEEHGVGAAASRLITGNHRLHVALEEAVGEWLRVGAVRSFGSGYAANVGTLGALLGPDDVVFSDELNHASIIDGCRLARAQVVVYPHGDLGFLDGKLRERTGRRRLIASESLFSMDGDLADVAELSRLAKVHGVALMLDEAHAVGARGPEGRGVAAAVGVVPDLLVGTCGKALGTSGAFVATTSAIAKLLWNRARSLVFSTATPPAIAAATIAAIEIVRGGEGDERRRDLAARAEQLRARVRISDVGSAVRGFEGDSSTRGELGGAGLGGVADGSIAPLLIGDDRRVMEISARLLERRIFVQGIRYPTVPEATARLRISVNAGHRAEDVEMLAIALDDALSHGRHDAAAWANPSSI
ncbi:MAG TPA: 8-amino-7-oxononanoate synthase [Kofleriaceae bacterium]